MPEGDEGDVPEADGASRLALPRVDAVPGETISIPLTLEDLEEDVLTLQTNLQIPAGLTLNRVTTGLDAAAAGKNVLSNDLGDGVFRVLAVGLNSDAIEDSDGDGAIVVAVVELTVDEDAFGLLPLELSGVVAATNGAQALDLANEDGAVNVLPVE